MSNQHNRVTQFLGLILLVGLTVLVITILSHPGSRDARLGSSPIPTVANLLISPLSTEIASIGVPTLVHTSGQGVLEKGDQDKISMASQEGNQLNVTLFDLSTRKDSNLTIMGLLDAHPSNHWLVGQEQTPLGSSGSYSRIGVIDVDTGEEIFLGNKDSIRQSPSISGNIVVWQDWRKESRAESDIYAYDLAAGKEISVAITANWEGKPRISGQWVIYLTAPLQQHSDRRPNTIELRAHSLETGEDFSIGMIPSPNNASWGTHHAIDGDKVAWIKVTNATWGQYSSELHLYDLATRTDHQLTESTSQTPMDVSLSATSKLVVYNTPSGQWSIVDWGTDSPTLVPFTYPVQSSSNPTIIALGSFILWEYADGRIYATPISR